MTVIIGGGLAGISAALHLRGRYRLLERSQRLGGLARTEERDGYYFDHTGHWLHLRDDYFKKLADELMGDELAEVARIARVYSQGVLTRYPYQANLHGLPAETIHECLVGLFNARAEQTRGDAPRNFEEYIHHYFGAGIAKHFMVPYNHKLWGVHPREITSAWCSRFVPLPDVEQIIAGAVGAGPAELGYNIHFRYPKQGGIETFAKALISRLDDRCVSTGCSVERIDPVKRTVEAGGETLPYHALIATAPLPALVKMLADPPEEITAAAARLRATSVRYLNVGTKALPASDYHWVYVPEPHLPVYRVGIFSNAMPSMAPAGCASLYVELSDRTPISDQQALVKDALQSLVEIKAISRVDDVVFADLREIDPAYVIFDDGYEAALETIHRYLTQARIYATGRYGAWIYNSMEDSLRMGKETAELVDALPVEENR